MIAGQQLSIGDASGAKLPSRFNSNRRKCGFRRPDEDVIENTGEKYFFSVLCESVL